MTAFYKNVTRFLSRPFSLLSDFESRLFLVVFSGVFSLLFIFIFKPFNIFEINYSNAFGHVITIWGSVLLLAVILSITELVIRPQIPIQQETIGSFLMWLFANILLLCICSYFIFAEPDDSLWVDVKLIFPYTASISIFTYLLACLLIAVYKLYQKREVEVAQNTEQLIPVTDTFIFKDEKGKTSLAIQLNRVILLQSDHNYTSVFFEKDGKVERKLIRDSLKNLELALREYPQLMRIHRSFLVNLQHIHSAQPKKRGYSVELELMPSTKISVSEKYTPSFVSHFIPNSDISPHF